MHFQEAGVPIESLYTHGNESGDLLIWLEKQFVHNYLLKGLQTWNVPLAQTINHLPPSLHQNMLPENHEEPETQLGSVDTIISA